MDKRLFSLLSILLTLLLVALAITILLIAPKTFSRFQEMQIEANATPTPTANVQSMLLVTIDPNNTPSPTPLILKAGSVGDEVKRLQDRLKQLGYYQGEIDGQYGAGSAEAVKLFQAQHSLTADGLAGNDTRNALFAESAQTYIPTPEPSPTPSKLQKGDRNDAVRALQERLQALGFYTSSIDGDYGGGTEQAIRLFQSQHGLPANGTADAETMALLNSDKAKHVEATPTPDPAAAPILINRTNPVPEGYSPANMINLRKSLPSDLVYVKGSEIEGDKTAVQALQTMLEAARADGITGFQVSAGYRSVKYQKELFDSSVNDYLSKGRTRESAISATRQTVADPGASEHHSGLAFDMTVAGTTFKGTKQQIWLHKNCWDYGYIIRYQEDKEKITGFLAEAWHIRYVGIEHSTVMRDKNLCLEEYLERL